MCGGKADDCVRTEEKILCDDLISLVFVVVITQDLVSRLPPPIDYSDARLFICNSFIRSIFLSLSPTLRALSLNFSVPVIVVSNDDDRMRPQRCILGSAASREQGGRWSAGGGQDHRQEGAQGQGRHTGERNQSPEEVCIMSYHWSFGSFKDHSELSNYSGVVALLTIMSVRDRVATF